MLKLSRVLYSIYKPCVLKSCCYCLPHVYLVGSYHLPCTNQVLCPHILPQIPATFQTLQLLEEEQMPGISII